MSRVHDALKKAGQNPDSSLHEERPGVSGVAAVTTKLLPDDLLETATEIPFHPAPDSHLLSAGADQITDGPAEEFRTLRTRMNHLQSLQPIRSVVVTSPSPKASRSRRRTWPWPNPSWPTTRPCWPISISAALWCTSTSTLSVVPA